MDVSKQVGFSVSFGDLGCRKAGDITLPSFWASMNSVGELVETIFSRIPIPDTNELAEAVDIRGGLVVVLPCPMTREGRRPGTFLLLREIGIICYARRIGCLEPEREWGLAQCFANFIAWDITELLRILGLTLP